MKLRSGLIRKPGHTEADRAIASSRQRNEKTLAEQGIAMAQYNLGNMYDFGEGVVLDDAEAARQN